MAISASAYYGRTYFSVVSSVDAEYVSQQTSAEAIAQRDGVEAALSSSLDWHSIYMARTGQPEAHSTSGLDWDLRNLDLAQFEFKYGSRAARLFGAGLQKGSAQNWAYLPAEYAKDSALLSAAMAAIAALYIILLKTMYLWPLRKHKDWVSKKPIFSKQHEIREPGHTSSRAVK